MKSFNLNRFKSHRSGPDSSSPKIEYVEEDGKRYIIRDGKRFEVWTLNQGPPPKTKRKAFKPEFVKLPAHWSEALEQAKYINTYRLAHRILFEKFRHERTGGEIVLTSKMTGMPSPTRHRAAKELEQLGLIKLSREGKNALKVTIVRSIRVP